MARVRSLLRLKELHDTVQSQATTLKAQTEELSEWNRLLEERVANQLAEIERINRLRRFLAPQVAQMIASSDSPDSVLLKPSPRGHGGDVRSARLHLLYRDHRTGRGDGGAPASTMRPWESLFSTMRARSNVSPATAS